MPSIRRLLRRAYTARAPRGYRAPGTAGCHQPSVAHPKPTGPVPIAPRDSREPLTRVAERSQGFSRGPSCIGHCADGHVCEEHPDMPWPHTACDAAGMPCPDPDCRAAAVL